MADTLNPSSVAANSWPIGKRAAFFTLTMTALLGAFDFIDRQVLAALLPYIKAEYSLSDTQLGLLVSIVNISIAILVVPSAYLIDRWSRKKMMAIMGIVWSLATGVCAIAGSYSHLLIARAFVGAGEAGYNPAAQSLLAASFPRHLRSTAIAVLQFSMAIGAPLGLMIGAFVATHWGWRHAFGIVAIPGLLFSMLCFLIRDFKTAPRTSNQPDSSHATTHDAGSPKASYFATVLTMLSTPSLLAVFLAQACVLMMWMTCANWLPSYYTRMANMPLTQASLYSSVYLVAGSIATLMSGPLWDRIRTQYSTRMAVLLQAGGCFIGFGIMTTGMVLLEPGSLLQLACIVGHNFFTGTLPVLGYALAMDLTAPSMRATGVSLIVTVQNIFGMAVGPLLTGILSDRYDLGTSISLMSCFYIFAGLMYVVVYFFYDRDRAHVPHEVVLFEV